MSNKDYKSRSKFYAVTCIIITLFWVTTSIMYVREYNSNHSDESYWSVKYDSLYRYYKVNEKNWDTFNKKSKGYYFVNPIEKKGIKNFDLIKFVEE